MKSILFSFCIVLVAQLSAQVPDPLRSVILTPEQMQEDLELYHRLLVETHPGLHRYLPAAEFEQAFKMINNQIGKPLPFYAFYQLLAGWSAAIRCAHTQLFPTRTVMDFVRKSSPIFPLYLYPIEDKLYVVFNGTNDTTITPGTELLSINNRTVAEIRKAMQTFHFHDGNGKTALRRFMQGGFFSMFYYFFIEQPTQFIVRFKKQNEEIIELNIAAQVYQTTEGNYASNHVNKKMMSFYNRKQKNWDFEISDEVASTAVIRFGSFGGKGMDSEREAQLAIQKFMSKAIKKMENKQIKNLILELRGNGGGWDIQGQELFSYLSDSKIATPYYESQIVSTIDSDFLEYSDISPKEMSDVIDKLEPLQNGTYRLTRADNVSLEPVFSKEINFSGNIYILVDEQCASTCAEFIAVAKAQGIGLLIGNESGGAYEGGNSGSLIHYELPNSGIFSTTPLVRYEMAVTPAEEKGRGTMPDYKVEMTLDDFMVGRDAQKEFVIDLIERN